MEWGHRSSAGSEVLEETLFMEFLPVEKTQKNQKLYSALLEEIYSMTEMVKALEEESTTLEDVLGMVGGLQRDIIQLYRTAQA
jgi:hypothetical protein